MRSLTEIKDALKNSQDYYQSFIAELIDLVEQQENRIEELEAQLEECQEQHTPRLT